MPTKLYSPATSLVLEDAILLLDAEAMSADITSALIDISDCDLLSLHITSAGTPDHVGNIYFRQTNTNNPTTPTPVAMAAPVLPVASGTAVSALIEITDLAGRYLQVFYDRTSGGASDTLTVNVWLKRPDRGSSG